GTAWSASFSPTSGFDQGILTAVYEASSTNVWAVGNDGTNGLVEHWNGTSWSRVMLPDPPGGTPSSYLTVAGLGGGNIWISGVEQPPPGAGGAAQAFAWHWNSTSWTLVRTPATNNNGATYNGPISSFAVLTDETLGSSPS